MLIATIMLPPFYFWSQ